MSEQEKDLSQDYKKTQDENTELKISNKELTKKIKAYHKEVFNFKEIDTENLYNQLKEGTYKFTQKINESIEYLGVMAQKLEVTGVDGTRSRRRYRMNKVEYRLKLIEFYEEGFYENENFMVYHASLLGGATDQEQLQAFISKVDQIKKKAERIGAYSLVEQAKALKIHAEHNELADLCNLLGRFIREYKKILQSIEYVLQLEKESEHAQAMPLDVILQQYEQSRQSTQSSSGKNDASFIDDDEASQEKSLKEDSLEGVGEVRGKENDHQTVLDKESDSQSDDSSDQDEPKVEESVKQEDLPQDGEKSKDQGEEGLQLQIVEDEVEKEKNEDNNKESNKEIENNKGVEKEPSCNKTEQQEDLIKEVLTIEEDALRLSKEIDNKASHIQGKPTNELQDILAKLQEVQNTLEELKRLSK